MVKIFRQNYRFGLLLLAVNLGHQIFSTDSKKIAVLGSGYVGLVTGTCFAYFGNKVICADVDKEKIEKLNKKINPIYEPGLSELLIQCVESKNLSFTTDIDRAIKESEIIFIAVGTPMDEGGKADLTYIKLAAEMIAKNLNAPKFVCTKSTVPVGTNQWIKSIITDKSCTNCSFEIISNPEFLREGSAVNDFLSPDRVVLGLESDNSKKIMDDLYAPLHEKSVPFIYTDTSTAEMIKYASNAFLATKISFINEIANLCEKVNADVITVAQGMGMDKRIGQQFLQPGPGFGGSCFPKDVAALIHLTSSLGLNFKILESALETNRQQKMRIFEKIKMLARGDIRHKTVAVLGLAFKANTDDIRYSPALDIIELLLKEGAHVKAYDPIATENMRKIYPSATYSKSAFEALEGSDVAVILTEWKEFKTIDLVQVKKLMTHPSIVDARNILKIKELQHLGFNYVNIGNAQVKVTTGGGNEIHLSI